MIWVKLWFVLITLAATCFALIGRRLFDQAKALTAALSRATDRRAEVAQDIQSAKRPDDRAPSA